MSFQAYLMRRTLVAIPTLLVLSLIVFAAIRLVPGDTLDAQLAEAGGSVSDQDRRDLRHQLGLDEPFVNQYVAWLGGIAQGDLGGSLWSGRPVRDSLQQAVPVTLQLAMASIVISLLTAVPLGTIAAVKRNSAIDFLSRLVSLLGLSVPSFVTATVLLLVLSKYFGWAPPLTYRPIWDAPWHNFQQFIFPSLILGYLLAAANARVLRTALVEVLAQDYIRTARAKGIQGRIVVTRHAMRNALIPMVTMTGVQVAAIISGSVVVESIFSLPGVGSLLINAVRGRDYPLVQGVVLFIAFVVVLVNLLVDLSYGWLDPRIRRA